MGETGSQRPRGPAVVGAWLGAENHSADSVLTRRWCFQNGNGAPVHSHTTLAPLLRCAGLRRLPGRALFGGRRLEAPKTLTLDPQREGWWVIIFSWSTSSFSPSRCRSGAGGQWGGDGMVGEVGKTPIFTSGHSQPILLKPFMTNFPEDKSGEWGGGGGES